jgi:hypothetical protein
MAKELDQNGDGFLSADEIKKASTADLHQLQGQLDGEAFFYARHDHSSIPFYDSRMANAAAGAGDTVDAELVRREEALPRMSTSYGIISLGNATAGGWSTNREYNQGISETIHGDWTIKY